MALVGAIAISGSSAATVYNPPWADAMWAHYPDDPAGGNLDTTSSMNYVRNRANTAGYDGFSTNPSSARVSLGTSYAQSDAIWWMAGHGAAGFLTTWSATNTWSYIKVDTTVGTCPSPHACLTSYTSSQMHRIRLMVFQGCETGDPAPSGDKLGYRAYTNLGVDSAVAFGAIIYFSSKADHWSDHFMWLATQPAPYTYTVVDAADTAAQYLHDLYGSTYGYDSWAVNGGSTKIYPPAYGS